MKQRKFILLFILSSVGITRLLAQQSTKNDPDSVKLITTDIDHFWAAYDSVKRDTANEISIYKALYFNKASPGLKDYYKYKIQSVAGFVKGHQRHSRFYKSIRSNTFKVSLQGPQIRNIFVKLKNIYAATQFPDIYFLIGNFSSAGTSTNAGLLIGVDQAVKTKDIPLDELNVWERNNFTNLEDLPHIIAHELIHYQQRNINRDKTLLCGVIIEGMADFIGELISGKTANVRLHVWARGKEKQIWADFKKEMFTNHTYNWIANSVFETPDKPADLGYWVGYQICKSYYDSHPDKNEAIKQMLSIKDFKVFYENSYVEDKF